MKEKIISCNQGFIGIIIVIIVVLLISGGLYFYLNSQTQKAPENSELPKTEQAQEVNNFEECVAKGYQILESAPRQCETPEGITFTEETQQEEPITPPGNQQEEPPKVTCNNECSTTGQKKCAGNGYQVCGNFDDDSCLEWGAILNCPLNTACQNGSCFQQKCVDGTSYSQCSVDKPKYCNSGNLINKCSICACPFKNQCQENGDCVDKWSKTYHIALIEFQPPNVSYEGNYLEIINNKEIRKSPSPRSWTKNGETININYYSFYYIEDFLMQEAKKYGKTISISVNVLGPFTLMETPPNRTAQQDCESILGPYFNKAINTAGIDISNYDIVSYIYFTNGGKAFWSCKGKNAYTARGGVESALSGYDSSDIETILHETVHVFGASDSYSGWLCNYPDGFAEPNKIPLYPQSVACLMCGSVPLSESGSGPPTDLVDYIICDKTAEEIGWK